MNVYLPDSLARAAKAAGLDVSRLAQEAVRRAINTSDINRWLSAVTALGGTRVSHEDVVATVAEAKRALDEGEYPPRTEAKPEACW